MLLILILLALPSQAAVSLATIDFGRCSEARKMAVARDGSVFVVAYTSRCDAAVSRKIALAKIGPTRNCSGAGITAALRVRNRWMSRCTPTVAS
jgi:hypothetical protein